MLPQGMAAVLPCTIYAASRLNAHMLVSEEKKDLPPQTISDASFVQITLIMVAKFALVTYFYIESTAIPQVQSGLLFAGECALLPICTVYLRPRAMARVAAFCLVAVNAAATVATVYFASRESTVASWTAVGSSMLHTLGSVAYISFVQNPNIMGPKHPGYTPLSQTVEDGSTSGPYASTPFDNDVDFNSPMNLHQNILHNRTTPRAATPTRPPNDNARITL